MIIFGILFTFFSIMKRLMFTNIGEGQEMNNMPQFGPGGINAGGPTSIFDTTVKVYLLHHFLLLLVFL